MVAEVDFDVYTTLKPLPPAMQALGKDTYADFDSLRTVASQPSFAIKGSVRDNAIASTQRNDILQPSSLNNEVIKMFQNVIESWSESIDQLKEAYAPKETIARTYQWVFKAFEFAPDFFAPDITSDEDGEINIEWDNKDKYITLYIRDNEDTGDGIVFKINGKLNALLLNEDNLKTALTLWQNPNN